MQGMQADEINLIWTFLLVTKKTEAFLKKKNT